MGPTKIGIPNFFSFLAFAFTTLIFICGLLALAGWLSLGKMPALGLLFSFIAWIFSAIVSFSFLKNFQHIIVNRNEIKVFSFFPYRKKILKFKDLDYVQWGADTSFFDNTVKYAKLHTKIGEIINFSDQQFENFDALMSSIPHENSNSKLRVYKNQAKDELYVILSLLLISVAAIVFFEYQWDYILYFFKDRPVLNLSIEDIMFRILFPITHLMITAAAAKRFVNYLKILNTKNPKREKIPSKGSMLEGFEYIDDNQMGYFAGYWQFENQKYPAEVYFYAPKENVLQSQQDQFDLLLKNSTRIKEKLEKELHRLLELEKFEYFDEVISIPLTFSIISILYNRHNHENIERDYEIELVGSKSYTNKVLKKGVEIIARINDGKIISMEKA